MPKVCSAARRALLVIVVASGLACSSGDAAESGGTDTGAETSTWQSGSIAVAQESGSAWTVAEESGEVVARHGDLDLALVIDATNADDDHRYAGVYVLESGQPRFTGTYYGSHCSTFVPDRPHLNQTAVAVTAAGPELTIEMTEGSLAEMVDSQYESDEPFRWTSIWSIGVDGLGLSANGLYYLLVPMESCDVTVLGEGGAEIGTTHIDSDTAPMLRYFEDVRTIELDSLPLGPLSVATDAAVLQVHVTSYPDTSLFELDFDHSFKDRGQTDVHVDVSLPLRP